MDLSHFLAQLMGSSLAIFALAALLRPSLVSHALRDFDEDAFSSLAIGFIAVVAGLALILSHNVWAFDWRGLVTLMGWISFAKGVTYLLAPKTLLSVSRSLLKDGHWLRVALTLCLILGLYLAFKGFGY